jgi:hypothetical protein
MSKEYSQLILNINSCNQSFRPVQQKGKEKRLAVEKKLERGVRIGIDYLSRDQA